MRLGFIETFDNLDFGGAGRGAQCFEGFTTQPRVDVEGNAGSGYRAFSPTPDLTVGEATHYVHAYAGLPSYLYVGPSSVDAAGRQATAVVLLSTGYGYNRLVTAKEGDVVHLWTFGQS